MFEPKNMVLFLFKMCQLNVCNTVIKIGIKKINENKLSTTKLPENTLLAAKPILNKALQAYTKTT